MLIEIYPETLMIQREDVIMRKLKHFKWQSMIAAVLYLIAGLLLLVVYAFMAHVGSLSAAPVFFCCSIRRMLQTWSAIWSASA